MIAPSLLILQISELLEFLNQSDTSDDLVVAGLVFLFVAVAGNISGKLEPGRVGRIAAGMLGSILLISGILLGVGMGSTPTPEATPRLTSLMAVRRLIRGARRPQRVAQLFLRPSHPRQKPRLRMTTFESIAFRSSISNKRPLGRVRIP